MMSMASPKFKDQLQMKKGLKGQVKRVTTNLAENRSIVEVSGSGSKRIGIPMLKMA
jgi:hypothetical protein